MSTWDRYSWERNDYSSPNRKGQRLLFEPCHMKFNTRILTYHLDIRWAYPTYSVYLKKCNTLNSKRIIWYTVCEIEFNTVKEKTNRTVRVNQYLSHQYKLPKNSRLSFVWYKLFSNLMIAMATEVMAFEKTLQVWRAHFLDFDFTWDLILLDVCAAVTFY